MGSFLLDPNTVSINWYLQKAFYRNSGVFSGVKKIAKRKNKISFNLHTNYQVAISFSFFAMKKNQMLNFIHSEKATKIWQNPSNFLTVLGIFK